MSRISSALLGTGSVVANELDDDVLQNRDGDSSVTTSSIVLIIVSAIIFVTVIALFDVIRAAIFNYFVNTNNLGIETQSHSETQLRSKLSLKTTMAFAVLCMILTPTIILAAMLLVS